MASAFCTAGKKALLDGKVSDTWKAALYTSSATIDASYTGVHDDERGGEFAADTRPVGRRWRVRPRDRGQGRRGWILAM